MAVTFNCHAQTAEDYIEAGREAFMRYDFDEATRQYGLASKKLKKETSEVLDLYKDQLELAESFLERVEKVIILDSISVPKEEFFKAYKLPVSAGSLGGPDALPFPAGDVEYVFTNEGDDFKMWAQLDTTGFYRIAESIRLTDGEWHQPVWTPEELGLGANAEYPFMMADGVTLYYASDGDESMGGYDIFVVNRDASTGEYLQPQNIGMPYNSPFDDYFLAVDELNGVGWWATDRNQVSDNLTVYVYKLNDLRKNYDPEEETDIISLARINDFRSTWPDEEDYTELVDAVRNITIEKKKKVDFNFPMSGGIIYTSLDDFRTSGGKTMMKKYLAALKDFEHDNQQLSELRRKYAAAHSSSLKEQISKLESSTERSRESLRKLRSEVYRAEGSR